MRPRGRARAGRGGGAWLRGCYDPVVEVGVDEQAAPERERAIEGGERER